MTFMVVDTDSYDILIGLDLLVKIGAIVDIEQGLIQVRHGPGTDVEVLPLTMVNLIQRSDSRTDGRDGDGTQEHTPGNPDAEDGSSLLFRHGTNERRVVQESKSNSDSNESSDEGTQSVGPNEGVSKFGDTKFEDLVKNEGPQQILQLTMQNKANDFMREELTDADDYADWIQWVADEEQHKQGLSQAADAGEESVLLQISADGDR
ncbi:unnamed protein product [Sphagnum troendelagicum]